MADAVEEAPELRGRSSPSPAASPEFQFWMVGENPSPALLTADELFSGGVVLPLHNLQVGGDEAAAVEAPDSAGPAEAEEAEAPAQPLAESGISPTPDLPAVTFKWKDIFKANNGGGEAKERKKAERRVSGGGNAELININIWPFSRSRSAGHGAAVALSKAKPTPAANASGSGSGNGNGVASNVTAPAARKVSSAPCSRSNSRGESGPEPPPPIPAVEGGQAAPSPAGPTSMLRRLVPGHHGRSSTGGGATGIRLGRPSPVWQLRRDKMQQAATEQKQASAKKKAAAAAGPAASDAEVTTAAPSVTAPAAANGCRNNAEGGEEGPNPPQGLLGLRTFFSKKVY